MNDKVSESFVMSPFTAPEVRQASRAHIVLSAELLDIFTVNNFTIRRGHRKRLGILVAIALLCFLAEMLTVPVMLCASLTAWIAALIPRIIGIVKLGPKKQMVWIHARRIVAFMENTQTSGDWTVVKFIRNTMSLWRTTFAIKECRNVSVPALIGAGCPEPTGIGFMYLFPESINKGSPSHGIYFTRHSQD